MTCSVLEAIFILQAAALVAAVLIILQNPNKLRTAGFYLINFAEGLLWLRRRLQVVKGEYREAWKGNLERLQAMEQSL
jgi:hypothetical protein